MGCGTKVDYPGMLLKEKRTKILWGTGKAASYISDICFQIGRDNWAGISYAVDSDERKRGSCFRNIEIVNPEEIHEWDKVFVIVAVGDIHYGQVKEVLEARGLSEGRDFISWQVFDRKITLGISADDHRAAAALFIDEKQFAAVEEHKWEGNGCRKSFPIHAVQYCMDIADISWRDIDAVVADSRSLWELDLLPSCCKPDERERCLRNLSDRLWIQDEIEEMSDGKITSDKIFICERGVSLAASSFYASPFEEAAVISFGEEDEQEGTMISVGAGNRFSLIKRQDDSQSLEQLFDAVAKFCGFCSHSDRNVFFSLSSTGRPVYSDLMQKEWFLICSDGSFQLHFQYKEFARLFDGPERGQDKLITRRERDLAASVINIAQEILLKTALYAKELTGLDNLCLAGGKILPGLAYGIISEHEVFKNIWMHPEKNAGRAADAACFAYYRAFLRYRPFTIPGSGSLTSGALRQMIIKEQKTTPAYSFWQDVSEPLYCKGRLLAAQAYQTPIQMVQLLKDKWKKYDDVDGEIINKVTVTLFEQRKKRG